MSGSTINLMIAITAMDAASSVIEGLAGKLAGSGGGMVVGALLAVGTAATVAGVALGTTAVKAAGDFQVQMTKLYTTAGEAHSNLQMVGDGILQMSGQVGTSATDLANAMYWIESGGYHGAAGLNVLRIAAMGAKAENADIVPVANSLTSALNAYAGTGLTAAQAMNTLIAATAAGKMTLNDLSGAVSNVLPATAKFGISLSDTTSAIATMTMQGDNAASAATHLRQLILALESPAKAGAAALASVGLTTQQVGDSMKVSLPNTLAMITDAIGKKFPEGSAAYNAALKNIAGGSKQMMGMLELTGSHMSAFQANVRSVNSAVKDGGTSIMGWSDVQANFNFKIDQAKAMLGSMMITIGFQLIPAMTRLLSAVMPLITAFMNWLTTSGVLKNAIGAVAGVINGLANSVTTAFAYMNQHATAQSLTMKLNVVQQSQQMAQGVLANLINQRQGILAELQKTHDAATHAMLETKLTAVNTSIAQQIGVVNAYAKQTAGIKQQLALIPSATNVATLQAKAAAINNSMAQAQGVMAAYALQRRTVEDELLATKDPVVRHMLEMKIAAINIAMQHEQGVINAFARQKAGVLAQASSMQSQLNAQNSNFFLVLAGGWNSMWAAMANSPLMHQMADFLISNFVPILGAFADAWNTGVMPALRYAWVALQPLMPLLKVLGMIILGVLIGPLVMLTAILRGVGVAFGVLLAGLAYVVAGIVSILSGVYQVASGFVSFFVDLFTGHFSKLSGDLGLIFDGIKKIIIGAFMVIAGAVVATLGTLAAYIWGFISGIINFFVHLANVLIGHSVIPEMLAAIVGAFTAFFANILSSIGAWVGQFIVWFENLKTQANQKTLDLVHLIASTLNNFIAGLPAIGANIIHGLISGITGAMGSLGNAMHNVVGFIGSFLPHSPAKQGELAHLNEYGPNIIKGVSQGMVGALPTLHASLNMVTRPIGQAMTGGGVPSGSGSSGASGGGSVNVYVTISNINDFGPNMPDYVVRQLTEKISAQLAQNMRLQSGKIVIGNG